MWDHARLECLRVGIADNEKGSLVDMTRGVGVVRSELTGRSGRVVSVVLMGGAVVALAAGCSSSSSSSASGSASAPSSASASSSASTSESNCSVAKLQAVAGDGKAIVSSRCESFEGVEYAGGIVSSGGQKTAFFAQFTNGAWTSVPEQELCSNAAQIAEVKAYCNGGSANDKAIVLPTGKAPSPTGSAPSPSGTAPTSAPSN